MTDVPMDAELPPPDLSPVDPDKVATPARPASPADAPVTNLLPDTELDKPIAEPPSTMSDLPSKPSEKTRTPTPVKEASPPPAAPRPAEAMTRTNSFGSFLQPAAISHASQPILMSTSTPKLPGISYIDSPSQSVDRPLNVTDALSYLDAVKVQFSEQPDVYNHFLDIMKDFKSQLIDTPGVIKRVSHLFNGHLSLIQGFNTFLPVGYRIECSTDAHDANCIRVTTPTGTMMQTTNSGLGNAFQWSTSSNAHPTSSDTIGAPASLERSVNPIAATTQPLAPPQPPSPPDPLADQSINTEGWDTPAIEPAVQYVQKIKSSCDPETYKKFLAILSKYHVNPDVPDGDARVSQHEEVAVEVAQLFQDHPDLQADFRVFMPGDHSQMFGDSGDMALLRQRTGTPIHEGKSSKRKAETPQLASAATVTVPQKRKRKVVEKEREREREKELLLKTGPSSKVKKTKQHHIADISIPSPGYSHARYPPSPNRRHHSHQQPQLSSSRNATSIPVHDESHFFDRVKRVLDNRETYNEFLKLINLFTQDYIDMARLVREARSYLRDGELMKQFKDILGWDERRERESWAAEGQGLGRVVGGAGVLDRPSRAELNLRYGSYRKLPAGEVNVTCSGRDEMCRAVLNDEWVSHPTWSSEDSGFIAHKKNVYEEALHRSEEERHEYDFHIEAIVRTIGMLEPINNKIAQLSPEERGNFKLKPNLGGSGKSIHQRVIKKIYGRESGLEVIQAMQESPALAIPVVLTRLKQKEEEWKRAQREWNKVWREVDARNYAKSLDCQGITFKAADKKAITTKAFLSQIEAARDEQLAKRASLVDPLFARTRKRHQLEFSLEDQGILQDSMKLTFGFLDRTQGQIAFAERKRIEGFLRSFVPLFFMLDPVKFNAAFAVMHENIDSDASDDVTSAMDDVEVSSVASGSGSSKTGGRSHRKGAGVSSGGDLRKKLLKSEQAKSTSRKTRAQEAASPSVSRLASPAPMDVDGPEESRTGSVVAGEPGNQNKRTTRKNTFFSNTVFYTLLRLMEVLYSRLSLFKGIANKLATQRPDDCQPNPVAAEVGLPSFADVMNLPDRNANAEHFYDLLLESCERLFDNELEQAAFEDQMRSMFGTKDAYKIFTIDKLIGALIKQVQSVMADPKSQDLLEILKRDATIPVPTAQDHINSRRSAEKVLGPDENLFRIDWLAESKAMTIQLLGKDDSSFDDSEVLTGRWQAYIDSFVSSENTEGLSQTRIKRPFLRKNLSPYENHPNIVARGGLEIKVCVRTYRLFFVSKTEDFLWTVPNKEEVEKASAKLQVRNLARKKWLARLDAGS